MTLTIGNGGAPLPTVVARLPAAPVPQGSAPRPAAAPAAAPEPAAQPRAEQVRQAAAALQRAIEARAPNSFSFSIDEATGKTVVRITDAQTGELIRQIPAEEMLEIARALERMLSMQAVLLRQSA